MKKYQPNQDKNVPFKLAFWVSGTKHSFKSKSLSEIQKRAFSMPKLQTHHPNKQYFSKHNRIVAGGQVKLSKTSSLSKQQLGLKQPSREQIKLRKSNSFRLLSEKSETQAKSLSKQKSEKTIQKQEKSSNDKKVRLSIDKTKKQSIFQINQKRARLIPGFNQQKKQLKLDIRLKKQQILQKQNSKAIIKAQKDLNSPQKIQQFCQLLEAQSLIRSENGIILFYTKENSNEYPVHELLSFENFYSRIQIVSKIKQNFFFKNFFQFKYFCKWKSFMRKLNLNKTKKQIVKQLETFDAKYLRSLVKYNQIIVKGYLQESIGQEIFVIRNIRELKIPLEKYKEEVSSIIINQVLKNINKNVLRDILKSFFVNFRVWYDEFVKANLEDNKKEADTKGLSFKKKFGLQNINLQTYEVKYKIEKQKKILKKLIYMQQETKLELLMSLLREIEWKIELNFKNYMKCWYPLSLSDSNFFPQDQSVSIQTFETGTIPKRRKSITSKFQLIEQSKQKKQFAVYVGYERDAEKMFKMGDKNYKRPKVQFDCGQNDSSSELQEKSEHKKVIQNNILLKTIKNILTLFDDIFQTESSDAQLKLTEQRTQNCHNNQNIKFCYKFQEHEFRFVPFFIVITPEDYNKNTSNKKQNSSVRLSDQLITNIGNRKTNNRQKNYSDGQMDEFGAKVEDQMIQLIELIINQLSYRLGSFCQNVSHEKNQSLPYESKYKIPQFIKESYCRLGFVNQMALNDEISQREFKMINEVVNSVDQYSFSNILTHSLTEITSIKTRITQILHLNVLHVNAIKESTIEVFKQLKSKIQDYEDLYKIYDYYQMINRFSVFLETVSDEIRVGNVLICIKPILQDMKTDIQNRKSRLISETPQKINQLFQQTLQKLNTYIEQISLTSWTLADFIKSYKKSLQFTKESKYIESQNLQTVHNLLLLINISIPKSYESYYMKYLALTDCFAKVNTKKIKFQQSISKKLKFLQPEKQQQIRKTEKQIELIIRKLMASVEKQILVVEKCEEQISELDKLISIHEATIADLELIKELEVRHCIKQSNNKHFHSFAKTKNQIKCILKLLKSYRNFTSQFESQIRLEFRSFRAEELAQKLERKRVKIKHSNRVLYQFENFIINCYSLYDKFKSNIELISLIQKLEGNELQQVSSMSHLFNLAQGSVWTAQQIVSINFNEQDLKNISETLQKKEFKKNFIKTLTQIESQISKIKFQVKLNQTIGQPFVLNISQNLNLVSILHSKVSSLKDVKRTFSLQNTSLITISKIEQVHDFLSQVYQCQNEYVQLKTFKLNISVNSLAVCFQKHTPSDDSLFQIIQKNKQLWQNLMETLNNAYLDHIVNYLLLRAKELLNSLSESIKKEWNFFKTFIAKKKEEFPTLSLFSDSIVLSILEAPQFFYTYLYPFVEKATKLINNQNLSLQLTTVYGQKLTVFLKKLNEKPQNQKNNQIVENIDIPYEQKQNVSQKEFEYSDSLSEQLQEFSVGKINRLLTKQMLQLLQLFYSRKQKYQRQKNSEIQEYKLPLCLIYIVDQLMLMQTLKKSKQSNQLFLQSFSQTLQQEMESVIKEDSDSKVDLNGYQKHITSLLVMSKIQFRDKLFFVASEPGWENNDYLSILANFFSYTELNSEIFLNCYHQKLPLSYQLVDYQQFSAIEPISQKVYISLVNSYTKNKCGVLQNSSNYNNLMARLLKIPYCCQIKSENEIQKIVKVGSKQNMSFLIKETPFQTIPLQVYAQIFRQIYAIKVLSCPSSEPGSIYKHVKPTFLGDRYHKYSDQKIHCPTIFVESKSLYIKWKKDQFQFSSIQMSQTLRFIQFCKPSFSFYLKVNLFIHKIEISDAIKFLIIEKYHKLQQFYSQSKNQFLTKRDIERFVCGLIQFCQEFSQIDQEVVKKYFRLFEDLHNRENYFIQSTLIKKQKRYERGRNKMPFIGSQKVQKSIRLQVTEFCQSLSKSPSLVDLYQQFHLQLQNFSRSILLYGASLNGKTHFYEKYFQSINQPNALGQNISLCKFSVLPISLKLESIFPNSQKYYFDKINELKLQNEENKKIVLILKDINQNNIQKLQSFSINRKLYFENYPPVHLDSISLLIQTRQLSNLPPKFVFECKKLYFHQLTTEWSQVLISKATKITEKLFQLQSQIDKRKKQFQEKNKQVLDSNVEKATDKQKIKKTQNHPLEIFCVVFRIFFELIDFKKIRSILGDRTLSEKYFFIVSIGHATGFYKNLF